MTHLLTPLYAKSLGMSGFEIGLLLSVPVLFQLVLTLIGGALTDRLGGKSMALASSAMLCGAGLLFIASAGFAMMFVAQVLTVLARAIFWPATWSLGSHMPGDAGRQMGLLNSAVNAGQVLGLAAAGFLIVTIGFRAAFGVMSAIVFAALVLMQVYEQPASALERPAPKTVREILSTYRALLGKRTLHYSILCSYLSALPLSLSFSFYPILLLAQGFDADSAGVLVSIRAIGGIAAGFVLGSWLKDVYGAGPPLICSIGMALAISLTSASAHPVLVSVAMFALGMGSAAMMLLFQMLITEASPRDTRGSAMALGTLGGSVSNLTTPLVMGILIDTMGVHFAFHAIAVLALAWAFALLPLRRRALEEAAA
jgi:MFS family permease